MSKTKFLWWMFVLLGCSLGPEHVFAEAWSEFRKENL